MDNIDKFTGRAEQYARFRPGYPEEYFDYLVGASSLSRTSIVADIGAGTGIFTKHLLNRGVTVYAVEPNADMRSAAQDYLRDYPGLRILDGCDADTRLAAHSIDLITVAQAFHWFNTEKFRAECRRILKPASKVALVWNRQVLDNALVQEIACVCGSLCPSFHGFAGSRTDLSKMDFYKDGVYDYREYSDDLPYSLEQFIGRSLSSSYAPKNEDKNYAQFVLELEGVFAKYNQQGILYMPNRLCSYLGEV